MVSTPYIFVRDSCFGILINKLSGHKYFKQLQERQDYIIPEKYSIHESISIEEKASNMSDDATRVVTTESSDEILVTWEDENDPENPYNWPLGWKVFFLVQMGFLTVSIYMGSSIYTPGFAEIQEQFNVGLVPSILPLSMFVLGYGTGPLIFAPLSEHPAIGRAPIYVITLFIYVILQIPTALATSIDSLIALRFLAGFFASPAIATGGASVNDMVKMSRMPIGLAGWSVCGVYGPTLGPLLGGVIVQNVGNWRWCFWLLLIVGSVVNLVLFTLLPESSTQTLLYRKAERLRALTGNYNITSDGHKKLRTMNTKDIIFDVCWRPFRIFLFEPIVLFINIYLALAYSIFYIFFEAFPLVFQGIYKFNPIEVGLSYFSVMVGIWIGCIGYIIVIYRLFTVKLEAGIKVQPEIFMLPAIVGASIMPIGMFIVGWASTASAHWIGPMFGAAIFAISAYVIYQTLFNYLAFAFKPEYLASVFASNGLFRAVFACSFPLFANQMYEAMGPTDFPVGWGCTLLGALTTVMIIIPVALYTKGDRFRARSEYAKTVAGI